MPKNGINTDALIDPLTNFFGRLNGDLRRRLKALIENPTSKTWDNAYSIILAPAAPGILGPVTLWKAVLKADPTFPKQGPYLGEPWTRVPDRGTLVAALRLANPARHDTTINKHYDAELLRQMGILIN